ncbi:MAG: hypothetical protein IH859_06095 [Chloroflexi bacterium]|nr:hypothetical protein [Chloroflexota bacterium]
MSLANKTATNSTDSQGSKDTLVLLEQFEVIVKHDSVSAIITSITLPDTASLVVKVIELKPKSRLERYQTLIGSFLIGIISLAIITACAQQPQPAQPTAPVPAPKEIVVDTKEWFFIGSE